MPTLPLSDIINLTVQVSPTAAVASNFNLGLIVGPAAMIPGTAEDRVRLYSSLSAMIADGFGASDAEYKAAALYFSQSPTPAKVAVGRWNDASETALAAVQACRLANTDWYAFTVCGATAFDILQIAAWAESATPAVAFMYTTADAAVLAGTALSAGKETSAAAPSTDITATTSPTFRISVDGDVYGLTPTYKSVTLDPSGLNTGAAIAAAMQTAVRALGGSYAAVAVTYSGTGYVITSGSTGPGSKVRVADGLTNDVAAALKIGAANGATDTDGGGSVALALKGLGYTHTLGQYSTVTADAVAAIEGYAMGANSGTAGSAYTLAYKSEVGVTVESLTESQVATIKGQNCNVYVNRGSYYNVFEQGLMASGMHFDVRLGLDQLVNAIRIAVMNLLTATARVPQTEGGMAMVANAIDAPCRNALTSGFLGGGVWTGPAILSLNTGDALPQGYRILSETMASQSDADRAARKSPAIYIPIKLAGAVEAVVITVPVNL